VVIAQSSERDSLTGALQILSRLRFSGDRLFVPAAGGSAANASHATNDFRKIAGLEAYCPSDNVAELTAWTNDAGWETMFEQWLRASRPRTGDVRLVLSVGGGSPAASLNLVRAMEYAKRTGARMVSVVSRASSPAHGEL
jgi:D-sedoheptulose 7-phosphate isomerase